MRNIIVFIVSHLILFSASGQGKIEKRVKVNQNQKVLIDLSFAKITKLNTWDGNEIVITGKYAINDGNNDEAFKLEIKDEGSNVRIDQCIADIDNLPRRHILKSPTQTIEFKSRMDLKEYKMQNPGDWVSEADQVDIEVELDIRVPIGIDTKIFSKFGTIEINEFSGPLQAHAKFGELDIALTAKNTGKVNAIARFGEIYTDLDWAGIKGKEENFKTSISAVFGKGPDYDLISEFGSLYIRKSK